MRVENEITSLGASYSQQPPCCFGDGHLVDQELPWQPRSRDFAVLALPCTAGKAAEPTLIVLKSVPASFTRLFPLHGLKPGRSREAP
jgi:hypothetical protein